VPIKMSIALTDWRKRQISLSFQALPSFPRWSRWHRAEKEVQGRGTPGSETRLLSLPLAPHGAGKSGRATVDECNFLVLAPPRRWSNRVTLSRLPKLALVLLEGDGDGGGGIDEGSINNLRGLRASLPSLSLSLRLSDVVRDQLIQALLGHQDVRRVARLVSRG
jgi:hypothetical protein